MAIYLLFFQHIMYSLSATGRASVVVPTGFLTGQDSISTDIRRRLVDSGNFIGAVAMPSNIFANTGTNVSVVFFDNSKSDKKFILMDATKIGTTIREGKNQRTILSEDESNLVIDTFIQRNEVSEYSVLVSEDEMREKNYSFSAGQYFKVIVNYDPISAKEFTDYLSTHKNKLQKQFSEAEAMQAQLLDALKRFELGK
jgi:type I restriction enzyme M protein